VLPVEQKAGPRAAVVSLLVRGRAASPTGVLGRPNRMDRLGGHPRGSRPTGRNHREDGSPQSTSLWSSDCLARQQGPTSCGKSASGRDHRLMQNSLSHAAPNGHRSRRRVLRPELAGNAAGTALARGAQQRNVRPDRVGRESNLCGGSQGLYPRVKSAIFRGQTRQRAEKRMPHANS
jgi:hypothetical protein